MLLQQKKKKHFSTFPCRPGPMAAATQRLGSLRSVKNLAKKGKSMKCMTVHPSREKHRRAEVFSLTTRRRRLKITTFSRLCKFRYSFQNDANDIKSFVFKRGRNGENGALKEKRKPGVCFSSQAERPSPVSL